MNFNDTLNTIISVGTILAVLIAVVGYLLSIKRKVDSDEFQKFMSEQRLALQKIESTLEAIKFQMERKINSEDIFEIRATIKTLTSDVESLKHGNK